MHHALLGVRRLISSRPVIKCGYPFLPFLHPARTSPGPLHLAEFYGTGVYTRDKATFRKMVSGRKSKVISEKSEFDTAEVSDYRLMKVLKRGRVSEENRAR